MPFPVSPNPGDSYTDAYGTVWIYAGSVNGWYRQEVIPGNETTYTGGGSGSATATGAAGEIQFTDGTNLAASPNLLWDDANDELEVTGDLKLLDGGNHTTTLQTITPTQNNTISLPNATGTVALVAGSSGQLLWNNAGANAGASTLTYDGSILTTSGRFINSYSSGSLAPAKAFTGTWSTGFGTTNTKPHVLIEPTGTTSTAWSTSGTGFGVNAASGFAGRLLDLQLNGTSNFSVSSTGAATGASFGVTSSTVPTNGIYLPSTNEIAFATNTTYRGRFDSAGRLLINTTSSRNVGSTVPARVQLEQNAYIAYSAVTNTNDVGGAYICLAKTRGTSAGSTTVVQANDELGGFVFAGADGTDVETAAGLIACLVDGTPGSNDLPGRLSFYTTLDGTSAVSERLRITNDGVIGYSQTAPAAVDTTATLTVADLKTGIITSSTAAAVTMTLPTGTLTEGGFNGLYNNFTFEWTVINTGGTNAVTVQGGTGHTLVGSGTVNANDSGRFASRRTATNTFVTYRLS